MYVCRLQAAKDNLSLQTLPCRGDAVASSPRTLLSRPPPPPPRPARPPARPLSSTWGRHRTTGQIQRENCPGPSPRQRSKEGGESAPGWRRDTSAGHHRGKMIVSSRNRRMGKIFETISGKTPRLPPGLRCRSAAPSAQPCPSADRPLSIRNLWAAAAAYSAAHAAAAARTAADRPPRPQRLLWPASPSVSGWSGPRQRPRMT